jgi:HD superfamily phosphohydrolase
VIESARLLHRSDGTYLASHHFGVFAIEGMLLARYHMHRQVYKPGRSKRARCVSDRRAVPLICRGAGKAFRVGAQCHTSVQQVVISETCYSC